jgi:hypothetical protein
METNGERTRDKRIFGTGQESQPDTVCGLVIFSSQPPQEERKLSYVSCDGRSN